jgi:hypothetical protein
MKYAILVLTICLVAGWTSANAMSFDAQGSGGNCDTCQWIAASGEITPSTPTEFQNFVAGLDPYWKIVYLSSPGGNVAAAMQLGRAFRKLGMTTVVGKSVKPPGERFEGIEPSECMSACVLAFAGGKARYYRDKFGDVGPDANKNVLGLHQFHAISGVSPEEQNMTAQAAKAFGIEEAQVVMGVEMAYLAETGVDPLLLTLASATTPGDTYMLTETQAIRFKLAMPENLEPEWQLKFHGQALVAEGQGAFEGDEYHVALWCHFHLKKRLFLGIRLNAPVDFGEDRVRPYQYYVTTGAPLSASYKKVPISFEEFYRKGGVIALSFGVDGPALAVLRSGVTFGLDSDAGHGDRILPMGTMRLDPRVVPTLLKTCER